MSGIVTTWLLPFPLPLPLPAPDPLTTNVVIGVVLDVGTRAVCANGNIRLATLFGRNLSSIGGTCGENMVLRLAGGKSTFWVLEIVAV
jgi:hypothetical protein